MSVQAELKKVFGVEFEEKKDMASVIGYESSNTFCTNDTGAIMAIHSSENAYRKIRIPKTWTELQFLDVSDNKNLRQVDFEGPLPKLTHFDASDSVLEELNFPAGFEDLKWLDASRNQLQGFTMEGAFPSLNYLDVSDNQIAVLDIPNCPALQEIYAQENEIQIFSITHAAQALQRLNLKENKLDNLPRELAQLKNLHILLLYKNPLTDIPSAIVSEEEYGNSADSVKNYLKELKKANIINDRAKLIIVGNGRVGKTSIRHRLAGDAFQENEKYTHGIEFEKLNKEHLDEVVTDDLQLQIWDFGGQEIFYATHQFFLTEEAVYILAWTNEENVKAYREKDKAILPFDEKWRSCEYWLENIRLHGKKSPIIMVQTHRDIKKNRLKEDAEWQDKYEIESLSFSAKNDYGLDGLKVTICEYLNDGESIPLFGKEFPLSYDNVIAAIEHRKKNENHITKDQFYALCTSVGIEKNNEHLVLDYLKKTGLVVYFDKPLLSDTVFINPNWLTEQVYQLINNDLRPRDGEIDDAYLEEILPNHTDEMRAKFVELLKAFELIFQPKGVDYLIAPQYLPKKLSRSAQNQHNQIVKTLKLGFVFRFPKFLPDNVMINFLSRYGPYSDHFFWNAGISFTNKANEACAVHFHPEDQSLHVFANLTDQGEALQREVCKSFIELSKNAYAEISIDGKNFVVWDELVAQLELLKENPKQQILSTEEGTAVDVIDFVKFWDKRELLLPFHQQVDELVGKNKLEEALNQLLRLLPDDKGAIRLLQSRLTELEQNKIQATLSKEVEREERNNIRLGILTLCKNLDRTNIRKGKL